jgi:hypothetical protein
VYTKLEDNIVNFGEIWKAWNLKVYSIIQKKSTKNEDFYVMNIFGPK